MKYLKVLIGKNNKVLRAKAMKIERVTPEIHKLAEKMFQTMKEADGIGLAAPQIAKSIQLFVVDELAFQKEQSSNIKEKYRRGLSKWEFKKIPAPDVSKGFAFMNPSISSYPKGQDDIREGCLSLPGWDGVVTRSKRITIKAQDLEGKSFKLQAKGLLARVIQHEYDHLQGVLICDKWREARKIKKEELRIKNIVFFGSSPYSQIVLDKLRGIPYEPDVIFGKNTKYKILNTQYSLGIVAAYGAIIPPEVIKRFSHGILNIHPSLLPKYRGPSPVQKAIINGDEVSGVSIIKLTERVDAGPIVAQREFSIDRFYTSFQLHTILFTLGAQLLLEILPYYLKGTLPLQVQDESKAIYTKLIKKEDGLISWQEDAVVIERKIRAYQSWPTAYTFFEHRGKQLRAQILEAVLVTSSLPLTVSGRIEQKEGELVVQCRTGHLLIKKLRPEGKREMTGEEFLRGYELEKFGD